MDRKRLLSQVISNGFTVTSEGVPCAIEYAKEGDALDYVITGNAVYHSDKNLLPFPYASTSKTVNGVIFTDNDDGTITANGTATANIWYTIAAQMPLAKGKYFLSGCPSGGGGSTYNMRIQALSSATAAKTAYDTGNTAVFDVSAVDFDSVTLTVYIAKGTACKELIFKPQLEQGTAATAFETYQSVGVGDPLKNLFNYTDGFGNSKKADADGWFDVTIDNSAGTSTKYAVCWTPKNDELKTNTKYYVYVEIAERSGDITLCATQATNSATDKGQFTSTIYASGYVMSRNSFDDCKTMLRTITYCAAGKSGHIKFRIAVYEKKIDAFEQYVIPIVNGGETIEIYRDTPLRRGQFLRCTSDNLPTLHLRENGNTITVNTAVQPSNLAVTYRGKVK